MSISPKNGNISSRVMKVRENITNGMTQLDACKKEGMSPGSYRSFCKDVGIDVQPRYSGYKHGGWHLERDTMKIFGMSLEDNIRMHNKFSSHIPTCHNCPQRPGDLDCLEIPESAMEQAPDWICFDVHLDLASDMVCDEDEVFYSNLLGEKFTTKQDYKLYTCARLPGFKESVLEEFFNSVIAKKNPKS